MLRPALALTILALTALAGAGQANALSEDAARHLLARTSFAATPAAIEALRPLSHSQAVEQLLRSAGDTAATPGPAWTRDWAPPSRRTRDMNEAERKAMRTERRGWAMDLKGWWYQEMIATPTPITEVMTLFWHNHFTSGLRKVKSPVLMYRQNVLLRQHALGNFGDLLRAVARDPAMLLYLDGARSRKAAPNENFARELLELFTLGEGHYGERDIKEAARAFTGWSLDRRSGEFMMRRRWHDNGLKAFLGRGGRFDGDDIIDTLLDHPRTAEQVAEKLWRNFVSEEPDPSEIERLAAIFRRSNYEIRPLLSALLNSPAFRDESARGRLIKSPVELIVGTVRQFKLPARQPKRLARLGRRLGQDIFEPPNVKGWPGGIAWISSETLLERQSLLAWLTGKVGADMAGERRKDTAVPPAALRVGLFDRWAAALPQAWSSADAITTLLLPLPPVDATILDRSGSGALVRRLLVDPVYQLK